MKALSEVDCGEKLDVKDIHKSTIEMLDELVEFCDKNNLRYYLSGGTLLGAIRHKGFIPWDDDIDINMPRPDVDKLLELCDGHIGRYEVQVAGKDPYSRTCMWVRLYDRSRIIENYYGESKNGSNYIYHPVFIDIFPIDGFPDGKLSTKLYCWKLIFIRRMLGVSWHDGIVVKDMKKYIKHILAYVPAKLVGYNRWCKMFQKNARKYDFDKCDYVGVTTTVQYLPREKVEKKSYIDAIDVLFEDKMYKAPGNYDVYLTNLYRNYMELPPEEKRNSGHTFSFYKNKNYKE